MNFERIANKHPSERATMDRLRHLISAQEGERLEFTFDRLCDLLEPNNEREFALMLSDLVKGGSLKQVIRVESPRGGGIGDFKSIDDIPATVHDWRTDSELEVRPQDLRIVYVVPLTHAT